LVMRLYLHIRSSSLQAAHHRVSKIRKGIAAETQLDAACSHKGRVIRFLAAVLILCSPVFPQSPAARQKAAQRALDAGDWAEAATLAQGPADQSPELDFLAGLALARLEKWSESKLAF